MLPEHHKQRLSAWLSAVLLGYGLVGGLSAAMAAGDGNVPVIHMTLGDYRFEPARIQVTAGQPVVLELENVDHITPHNLTLRDAAAGLDVDVDVSGGHTTRVELTPTVPGTYTFYCNKKLLFMKSHREHGMEGTLTVTAP